MTRRDPVKLRVANQKAYLWDLNGSSFCSLRLEFDETRRARLAHTKSLGMPRAYRCAIPPSAASYLRRPFWNSAASDAAERLSRTPARLDAGRGRPPRPKRSVPSHEQSLIAKIRIAALTPPVLPQESPSSSTTAPLTSLQLLSKPNPTTPLAPPPFKHSKKPTTRTSKPRNGRWRNCTGTGLRSGDERRRRRGGNGKRRSSNGEELRERMSRPSLLELLLQAVSRR